MGQHIKQLSGEAGHLIQRAGEMMSTIDAKTEWEKRANEISENRNWSELRIHFLKHLGEMEHLDAKKEPERAIDKAWSLLDLCMFAIGKMGIEIDLDKINYARMLERINVHEKYLGEQKIKDEENRKRRIQKEIDDDSD